MFALLSVSFCGLMLVVLTLQSKQKKGNYRNIVPFFITIVSKCETVIATFADFVQNGIDSFLGVLISIGRSGSLSSSFGKRERELPLEKQAIEYSYKCSS